MPGAPLASWPGGNRAGLDQVVELIDQLEVRPVQPEADGEHVIARGSHDAEVGRRGGRGDGASGPGVRVKEGGGSVHPVQARANFVIAGAPAGGAFNQATGDTIAIDEDENARVKRQRRQLRRQRQGGGLGRFPADGHCGGCVHRKPSRGAGRHVGRASAIPSVKVAVRAADRTDRHRVHELARHTIPPPRGRTSTRVPGKGAGWAHMYLAESRLGRHSRKMPTSDWESVRQLRGDALWKDADQVLLTRAMLRCGLAAGWVTLAALTISGGAWIGGLPMLQAWGLSLLTASHTVVLRVEGRLPRPLRRLFERLFVYPDQPHVNWVGIAELLGLVSLGMATGWPLRLLADDPAAAAVGSVITVGILGSVVANTAGHLVWELDQDDTAPKWMRNVRMFIGPFGAAVGLALLWWASPATPARFVAVAGPLLVMVGSWRLVEIGR